MGVGGGCLLSCFSLLEKLKRQTGLHFIVFLSFPEREFKETPVCVGEKEELPVLSWEGPLMLI